MAKLKGNSFYMKMIKDIAQHYYTTFTADEKDVNNALRSMFFEDLEDSGEAYKIIREKER